MGFWDDEYLNEIWEKGLIDPLPEDRNEMEIHPSYTGCRDVRGNFYGSCTRKAWYSKKYPESSEEVDVSGLMIMNEGNFFEAHANQIFMAAGVAIRPNPILGQPRIMIERTSSNGVKYFIVGRIDMIYRNQEGQRAIIDFKRAITKNSIEGVMGTSRYNNDGPKAKDQNIIQMAVYADWGRQSGIFDCKLAYAMPSERCGKVFRVKVDGNGNVYVNDALQPFTMGDIYKEYDHLADCLHDNKPPERPFTIFYTEDELDKIAMTRDIPKSWRDKIKIHGKVTKPYAESPCLYCDFCKVCHGAEETELALKIRGY